MHVINKGGQKPLTVGFVALGCPKNIVDSEKMLALIAQAGFIIDYDADNADVVVINTCGFIKPAIDEAAEAITRALARKRKGKVKKVVVAGCLPERMKEKLLEKFPQTDAVVCLGARDDMANVIKNLFSVSAAKFYDSPSDWTSSVQKDTDRLLINSAHWAYLRISEGCDMNCSFCTIPAIKGRFRSKPLDDIVTEANQLADAGIVEISIIAQDSTNWGRDFGEKEGLLKIVGELEKIEKLKWLRLMYLNPSGISDSLIDAVAKSKKVVHYIDMPIQHISDEILKKMHRPDMKQKITKLIEKLRESIPDIVLRTTVIVGFPGETNEQFEELLNFIEQIRFDALGCFTFWPEEGTKAAQLPNRIPQDIKEDRHRQLMLAQQQIVFEKNKARKGQIIECLVDGSWSGQPAVGRYYGQAPHIDSVCFIDNCTDSPGTFLKAEITGFQGYDLLVKRI